MLKNIKQVTGKIQLKLYGYLLKIYLEELIASVKTLQLLNDYLSY